MRKLKLIIVGAVAALLVVATPTAYVAATTDAQDKLQGDAQVKSKDDQPGIAALTCRRQSAANGSGQDIVLSTREPRIYSGVLWQNVECTNTTFRLGLNQRALVVADVAAEADCRSNTPTSGEWCEARALLNGVEGEPQTPEPSSFAFDSVAGGTGNYEAHAFNRAWEVRCLQTAGCQYRFVVQTKMHSSSVSGLWLDDIGVHLRVTPGNPAAL